MTSTDKPKRRSRGTIDTLPSGSLRVRVHAGVDPVSGKRHDLVEIVPAGPNAEKQAEKVRTKLLGQVDERRNARTKATVNQLLDKYFDLLSVETNTHENYVSLARNHIRPLIGDLSVGRIDGELLDSFYKELRTCRLRCRGRKFIEHRTPRDHECDDRCQPHKCKGLANGSLRKIHAVLMGAGKRAVRWRWVGVNPFEQADPLPAARPEPKPPTADQAAKIATEAWKDLDWGMLVWLAMVTGARRGELCALAWDRVVLKPGEGVLTIRSSIAQRGARTWEKPTKTHQQRRITIDDTTVRLLTAYRQHCAARAELDDMPEKARIFSSSPNGSTWLKPDSVSQRYARMCARKPLKWDMHIHQLRHYSATELISSGVDVTTVGGRLGHGGGGSTTLRFYSAWVSEADQRAAGTLSSRLPHLPVGLDPAGALKSTVKPSEDTQYQRIAADLRGAIACGALKPGDKLPAFVDIARRYGVSFNTAQRAVKILESDGLVSVVRGKRASVIELSEQRAAHANVVRLGAHIKKAN
jgi:integrase/DNA-binding transcriptional regulator YhcF (GntR family)